MYSQYYAFDNFKNKNIFPFYKFIYLNICLHHDFMHYVFEVIAFIERKKYYIFCIKLNFK